MSEMQQQPGPVKRVKPKCRGGAGADHVKLSNHLAPERHNDRDLVFEVNPYGQRITPLGRVVGTPGFAEYRVQYAYQVDGRPFLVERWVDETRLRGASDEEAREYERVDEQRRVREQQMARERQRLQEQQRIQERQRIQEQQRMQEQRRRADQR